MPIHDDGDGTHNSISVSLSLWLLFFVCGAAAFGSDIFSWIYFLDHVSENGVSLIEGIVTFVLIWGVIFGGTVALNFFGIIELPKLIGKQRRTAIAALFCGFGLIVPISQFSAQIGANEERARVLQMDAHQLAVEEMWADAKLAQQTTTSGIATVQGTVGTAENLYIIERTTGSVNGGRPGEGKVTAELRTITRVASITEAALVEYKADTEPLIRQGDRLVDNMRRLRETRRLDDVERAHRLRDDMEALERLSLQILQTAPYAHLEVLQETLTKNWMRLGFSQIGAAKMTESFAAEAGKYSNVVSQVRDLALSNEALEFVERDGLALIAHFAGELAGAIIAVAALDVMPFLSLILVAAISGGRSTPRPSQPPVEPRTSSPIVERFREHERANGASH